MNSFFFYIRRRLSNRGEFISCLSRIENSEIIFLLFQTKYIRHIHTQDCLKVARTKLGLQVILETCMGDNSQMWRIDNFDVEKLSLELQNEVRKHM